jgi:hypothetical protein
VHGPSRVRDGITSGASHQRCRCGVGVAPVGPVGDPQNRGSGGRFRVGPLESRNDHGGLRVDGDHEHGDAFSDGHGCIPREVQQVRSGSDQDAVEPGILGGVGCSPQPLGEVIGGERSGLGKAAMIAHGSHFRARGITGQPVAPTAAPVILESPVIGGAGGLSLRTRRQQESAHSRVRRWIEAPSRSLAGARTWHQAFQPS